MSLVRNITLFTVLYLYLTSPLSAATITQTYRNNNNASVDPNSTSPVTRNLIVPPGDFPTGMKIIDVNIAIRFDKRDEGTAYDGVCRSHQGGGVYNNEIGFVLSSPNNTEVALVNANSGYYSGSTRPGRVNVTFDDEGAVFTGSTPVTGTFRPQEALSTFDNSSNIDGTWTLEMSDSAGQDPLCFFRVILTITASNEADISVTKTDNSDTYTPGEAGSYTLTVSNAGPISAEGALVNDTLPNGATGATWTCTGAGGSSCATASGSGNIVNESVDLAVGGTVTFTVNFTWSTNPADY